MNEWYFQDSSKEAGPFTFEELKYLVSRGKVKPNDLIRSGAQGAWIEAAKVEGLVAQQSVVNPTEQIIPPVVTERASRTEQAGTGPSTQPTPALSSTRQRPNPPALTVDDSNRRQRIILTSSVAAAVLLLLLLLCLLAWLWPRHVSAPQMAGSGGRSTSEGQGAGAGREETQGNQGDGDQGGQPELGDGGMKLDGEAVDEVSSESREAVEESIPGDAEPEPDEASEPDSGESNVEEEPPPEATGLTVLKFVPREHGEQAIVLGSGRDGGEAPKMFKGRDAEQRAELAEKEGGTPESEAAVERGLDWLVRHQHQDGHWSLDRFMRTDECNGQCQSPGRSADVAATALALMPLLGAGNTHGTGQYQQNVRRGLQWLIKDQQKQGNFKSVGSGTMYAHGQASIVLCEAYAMTGDDALRQPAQLAIDYICKAQHKGGGWRYSFNTPGDTSVMGWQILGLKSAQSGGLDIAKDVFTRSHAYLDRAQTNKIGSQYGYTPGSRATPTMSAEGILCRMYCGWPKNAEGLREGADYLLANLPNQQQPNIYYWYYGSQVMHHRGGRAWTRWNKVVRDALIAMQVKDGHESGSWKPVGGHSNSGGRIYMTSLALCTLEIYYRHAALYD